MRPYPAYRDSGVEWLGGVPEHWETTRLRYLLSRNDGGAWGEDDDPEGTVVLRSTEQTLDGGWRIDDPARRSLSSREMRECRLLPGDLVVTKSSGSALHIGKASLVTDEVAALKPCFSNFMQRLRFSTAYIPRLGWYLLNCSAGRQQLVFNANTTTGLANLTGSVLGNVLTCLPPLPEQHAIASFLDRETTKLDDLVARNRALLELLKEKRSALISRTVTRGLPPEAARAAGLDPHPRFRHSGVEWIGEVPEHWSVKRVKHLGSIRYGLGEPPEYVDEGLPFVRATDINRGKIDLNAVKQVSPDDVPWSRDPMLRLHEVLVVRSGAYTGDSALVTEDVAGCIAGYDMVITARSADPRFLAWVLLSKYMLQGQIHVERLRAAQPHLNAEELGGFAVLTPPAPEQRAIADYLDRETAKLDQMAVKVEEAIARLQEYRAALITAAVTGKIDVRGAVV